MIEILMRVAKEIINLCDLVINKNESPNIDVLKIIRREFIAQYNSLENDFRVIVLNKQKDLWVTRTIIDSAYFEYDKFIFDKVYEFDKLCKKLPLKNLRILY